MQEHYIEILKNEIKKSIKENEVPVAALIVCNNKIISKAHNLRERKNNPLMHAEIIAISKAAKKLKSWKLIDCELYVTLYPCQMCKEVIKSSRIKKVYYLIDRLSDSDISVNFEKMNSDYSSLYRKQISDFFKLKR